MKVTDKQIVTALKDFIDNCDVDELADMAGTFLGGSCHYEEEGEYEFIPNDKYCNDFGEVKK